VKVSPTPLIFGCAGLSLSDEERDFFQKSQPLGFILFKRNVQDKAQVMALVEALKATVNHVNPPILIDQEGGRVVRLKPPHWQEYAPVHMKDGESIEEAKARIHHLYTSIAKDLREVGITVNCAPMLDLDVLGADPIMGDRTFSTDPTIVSILGAVAIQAMQEQGIIPVMKHIPGHGAALCDSHKELPLVTLSRAELEAHFAPFKENINCPWAMTAHIVYIALDPDHCATQSSLVIHDIIREELGFKGVLVSDDIGMSALSGSFAERTRKSLEAGCDVVLHCSGILEEMIDVMRGV
jgi:beta-N-acetylhexosaminidase